MSKKDGRRWATIAQIQWILSWLPEYLEAQRTNTFHLLWPKLFKAWFLDFPCRYPTAADLSDSEDEQGSGTDVPPESADEHEVQADQCKQKKKAHKKKAQAKKKALTTSLSSHDKKKGRLIHKQQEQLKMFLRWHCPSSRSSRKKADGATCACQLFDNGTTNKPFRRLQETEAYIKLYYESHMLEPPRKRVAEPGSPHLINVIREVARDMWAADKEDEDTRDTISAYIEKHVQEHLQEIAKAAKALEAVVPTPEQYQEAITALPAYLEGVLRQVTRRTGFSVTVIMGGPVPMDNGTIHTASISTGKNPLTNATFKESYEAFDAAVLRPYNNFLRNVYSSRSLASGPSQINIAAQQPSDDSDGTHTQSAPHTADLDVNDTPPARNANMVPVSDDYRTPPTAHITERAAGSDDDHNASSATCTDITPSLSLSLHRAATSPALEERAAQEAAAQQAQEVAAATVIAQTAAGVGAGEAQQQPVTDPLDATAAITVPSHFPGSSTTTLDALTISPARSPGSFITAPNALMTDVEDNQPRRRHKITVTVAGAALAAEKELNAARAQKAAQTRANNTKKRAGENLEVGMVKKSQGSKSRPRKKKHAP